MLCALFPGFPATWHKGKKWEAWEAKSHDHTSHDHQSCIVVFAPRDVSHVTFPPRPSTTLRACCKRQGVGSGYEATVEPPLQQGQWCGHTAHVHSTCTHVHTIACVVQHGVHCLPNNPPDTSRNRTTHSTQAGIEQPTRHKQE